MNIIELKGVNKFYGQGEGLVHALCDIDLEIACGDFLAIMGQSGSGKTTLMNTLGCLDAPSDGIYILGGLEAGELTADEQARQRGRTLGFVFQRYNLLPTLNALDNVALPAVYSGLGPRERLQRAAELLERLGLSDKFASFPHQLSGGQQQRVSIARSLMNGGHIILADEPSGALDSESGRMVMEILGALNRDGHTVIVVTHDPQIASYARRVVELKDGRIISDTAKSPFAETKPIEVREPKIVPFIFYRDQFLEALKMSLQAITAHKLRSLLTMLGIIIGIASVVSVVALGQGSQEKVLANISSMGTNTITINPGTGFGDRRSGRVRTLTVADSEILGQQSYLASSTPVTSTSGTLVFGNQSLNASLTGVGEDYLEVRGLHLVRGRRLTTLDIIENASVTIIDHNTWLELFPDGSDPIGQTIIFRRQPLTVIGLTSPQELGMGPQSSLNLWSPYTTVMTKLTGERHISSIIVKVSDQINTQVAEKTLTALLTARHGGRQDFHTQNTDTIRQTIESTTATMTLMISSIALISLIVGGIGVMNIMLVSVTERTREIGVRMAIGAKRFNILEQFLIEAVLLCIMGGVAGVALSGLVGFVFNNFTRDFHMSFSTGSIILALGCSTLIGVLFGFLPAHNASHLNPIEALSYE
ncbi:MAG: MacB family efflux pump subunit [Deltaproteobacteria bacterium]|jgi:macrolide transport system ATP-binding/permease protein|nr:MacB family efflux pump subunit [Deltaproteobacteria bacterium]